MKYLFFFALSLLFIACTGSRLAKNQSTPAADSLTTHLLQLRDSGYFNGFAVAIVNEQGIVYQKGFGYADVSDKKPYTETTLQNIGSVSKTLVGVALMKAQELVKLKLDDPINNYLPFKVVNPNSPQDIITIRHLATHTSGILDNEFYLTKNYSLQPAQNLAGLPLQFDDAEVLNPADSLVSLKDYLQNVLTTTGRWYTPGSFANRKPGELYEYSNVATALAAYVIERACGEDFAAFTRRYILQPLKMKASGWRMEEVAKANHSRLYADPQTALPFYRLATYPDGNFITSVSDLGLYLSELIKGYNGKGMILSVKSYKELYRPQLTDQHFTDRNRKNPYSESFNVGVFMGFGYTGYIGHTGGDPGVATMLFFNLTTGTGRIFLVNTSITTKAGGKLFYSIWDALEKYGQHLSH